MTARVLTFARDEMLVRDALDGFLGSHKPSTRTQYEKWIAGVAKLLPDVDQAPLSTWTTEDLSVAFDERYGHLAPNTRNARIAAVRSFLNYCRKHGYPIGDTELVADRAAVKRDPTKAIDRVTLDRFLRREKALRESVLHHLMYETAARADEALSLDVEDLDRDNNRARIVMKGETPRWAVYQTATAQLLPRLLRVPDPNDPGRTVLRTSGPLFLTGRRAPDGSRRPAPSDVCPITGRARLSYGRAETLFKELTGGWTLHVLRHSRATHLAEDGYSIAEIMAITGHTSMRSLEFYVRLGYETAARIARETDPAARRRRR